MNTIAFSRKLQKQFFNSKINFQNKVLQIAKRMKKVRFVGKLRLTFPRGRYTFYCIQLINNLCHHYNNQYNSIGCDCMLLHLTRAAK